MSKNLAFEDPSSKKLHDLTDITVHIVTVKEDERTSSISPMRLSTNFLSFRIAPVLKQQINWPPKAEMFASNLIYNPKKFNVGIDDLGAKPCIPHKSLLQ